jgi:endonuclease III
VSTAVMAAKPGRPPSHRSSHMWSSRARSPSAASAAASRSVTGDRASASSRELTLIRCTSADAIHRLLWSRRMGKPRTAKGRARVVRERLAEAYPEAICELDHRNPFELLTATILSAQTTDKRVNMVTPALFAAYPTPHALAGAAQSDVEELVRSTGFYASKARNIIAMATDVVERFGGEVPQRLEDLVTLAGVGRKTANVVRSVAFDLPGLPVDTHVLRLSKRLALTDPAEIDQDDPVKVELALNALIPAAERGRFSLRMILHGRRICDARKPQCDACVLRDVCPSAR